MKKSDIRAWLKSWDAGEFDFTAALPQNYSDPNANAGNTDHPWKLEPVDRLEQGEIRSFRKIYPFFAVALCCIMISFLLLTVANLPTFGSPDSPAHNEVMARYVENGMAETGAVNVVAGVILAAVGVYEPIKEFAGCGATVPLTGFGYTLVEGTKKAIEEQGLIGALTGPISACSAGVMAALLSGLVVSLLTKPKSK